MKQQLNWMTPAAGVLLVSAAASLAQDQHTNFDSTNRLTLSLRFGLNISGKFKGIGSTGSPFGTVPNRQTPNGDSYNYDDGYVYPDVSGNGDGQTWYWGYDNSSAQVSGDNILLSRTTINGGSSEKSADADPCPGFELTYNRELGVAEKWHHLRYGVEGAANYMPISFTAKGPFSLNATRTTDSYAFTSGTTPPSATPSSPYQGDYDGPGFLIGSTPNDSVTTSVGGYTLQAHEHFEANLFGIRLGPYVEVPLTKKLDLHVSGGLAIGLIDARASWQESYSDSTVVSGHGSDFNVLCGAYLSAAAIYQFNERWSAQAGAQFQTLGTYSHNFGGRTASLDLSQSILVQTGIGYSF